MVAVVEERGEAQAGDQEHLRHHSGERRRGLVLLAKAYIVKLLLRQNQNNVTILYEFKTSCLNSFEKRNLLRPSYLLFSQTEEYGSSSFL